MSLSVVKVECSLLFFFFFFSHFAVEWLHGGEESLSKTPLPVQSVNSDLIPNLAPSAFSRISQHVRRAVFREMTVKTNILFSLPYDPPALLT